METQPEFERESDMGRPVFRETDPNSLFIDFFNDDHFDLCEVVPH